MATATAKRSRKTRRKKRVIDGYLNVTEAGAFLGVHPRTITRMIQAGRLACIDISRSCKRILKDDLVALKEAST